MTRPMEEDSFRRYWLRIPDILITLLLWCYFTLGYVLLFSPFHLGAWMFSKNREQSFQRLNYIFFRGFFFLLRVFAPSQKWDIPENIRSIRSSIIISNHVSFLDPLLLISFFEKQKTIVKSRYFKMPIFRLVLRLSGYIPSASEGYLSKVMIRQVETIGDFLRSGGNLFVFPEGTRSRDGTVGRLHKGVFKIARLYTPPVIILFIRHTDKLFPPGRFLFHTRGLQTISVEQIACIEPDYQSKTFSVSELMLQAQSLLEAHAAK